MSVQEIRESFRPRQVVLLLVGESPPASGAFFYTADSRLFRATRAAFAGVYADGCPDGAAFLPFFQACGCFLEDLCLDPVNGLDDATRRARRETSRAALADRIRALKPGVVVSVFRGAEDQIWAAARAACVSKDDIHGLPFPAYQWERLYIHGLSALVERYVRVGDKGGASSHRQS